MFEVSQTGRSEVGIGTGSKPPVEPPSTSPFVQASIRPSVSLHPVVEERDGGCMDDSCRREMAHEPRISAQDIFEEVFRHSMRQACSIDIEEVIPVSQEGEGKGSRMRLERTRTVAGGIIEAENPASVHPQRAGNIEANAG